MVPIYAGLEKVTLMVPLMAAKQEAAKNGGAAHGSMSGKQSQQSSAEQPSRTDMTPVVAGVEAHHTHIMLDVSAAEEHLQAAKQALNNNKYEAADGALAAVAPGRGTQVRLNDQPLLSDRGPGLTTACLDLWIGAQSVSQNLRRLLLNSAS